MDKNILTLAYLGDAVYEIYIRRHLVAKTNRKVKDLQKEAVRYVSAPSQSAFLKQLQDASFFTKEEEEILFRARNHDVRHHPKNTDILTYKHATALEAILGFLAFTNQETRIKEIMEEIIKRGIEEE